MTERSSNGFCRHLSYYRHLFRYQDRTRFLFRLDPADPVVTGGGYWIYSTSGGIWDATGDLTTYTPGSGCSSRDGCYEIRLTPAQAPADTRFNLIGHPGSTAVAWADVRVWVNGQVYTPYEAQIRNYLSRTFYKYNGSSYDSYDDGTTPGKAGRLKPQEGIWVKTLQGSYRRLISLLIPKGEASTGTAAALAAPARSSGSGISTTAGARGTGMDARMAVQAASGDDLIVVGNRLGRKGKLSDRRVMEGGTLAVSISGGDEWYMMLSVEAPEAGLADRGGVTGQVAGSSPGYDMRDIPELPPYSRPFLTLGFPHQDWGARAGDYDTDFHGTGTDRADVWDFTIRSDAPDRTLTLRWGPVFMIRSLPAGPEGKRGWEPAPDRDPGSVMNSLWLYDPEKGRRIRAFGAEGDQTYTFSMDGLEVRHFRLVLLTPDSDRDGDLMADRWEREHLGDLSRDGAGDLDGDGINDRDEYWAGTDPAGCAWQAGETPGMMQACVSHPAILLRCLEEAGGDGFDNRIMLIRRIYRGNFSYSGTDGRVLHISGGWDSECSAPMAGTEGTILDGGRKGAVLALGDSAGGAQVFIDGLTVRNGRSETEGGCISLEMEEGEFLLTDTVIRDCVSSARGGGLSAVMGSGAVTVSNTVIMNSRALDGGGLMASTGTGSINILSSTLWRNRAMNQAGGALLFTGSAKVGVSDSIFWANRSPGKGSGLSVFPDGKERVEDLTHISVQYNDLCGRDLLVDIQGFTPPETDICVSPGFRKGDYHLSPDSACIDAGGSLATLLPGHDIDGDPRPTGQAVDIGADEAGLQGLPDLEIGNFSLKKRHRRGKTAVLTILNRGTVAVEKAFRVQIFLSEDDELDSKDRVIKSIIIHADTASLRPGGSRRIRVPLRKLRVHPTGRTLFAVVDADDAIHEADEGDNAASVALK